MCRGLRQEVAMEDSLKKDQCKIEIQTMRQFREEIPEIVKNLTQSCSN